jgi:hypothetical protein
MLSFSWDYWNRKLRDFVKIKAIRLEFLLCLKLHPFSKKPLTFNISQLTSVTYTPPSGNRLTKYYHVHIPLIHRVLRILHLYKKFQAELIKPTYPICSLCSGLHFDNSWVVNVCIKTMQLTVKINVLNSRVDDHRPESYKRPFKI